MNPLDRDLAVSEGRKMLAAFRRERGVDETEETSLADAIVSLFHAQHAAGTDPTDVAREVMSAVADFWTEVGRAVELPVNERLGCNVRGRLDAVERAAVAGDDREARRELLALLKFFPKARP